MNKFSSTGENVIWSVHNEKGKVPSDFSKKNLCSFYNDLFFCSTRLRVHIRPLKCMLCHIATIPFIALYVSKPSLHLSIPYRVI